MNLLQITNDLKQIAAECDKVTSGNVSHKIANIEQGILNITYYLEHYCELGWHPASELPVIPEGKNCVKVVALVDFGDNTLRPRHEIYKDKGWSKKDMWTVKYWCYPPDLQ